MRQAFMLEAPPRFELGNKGFADLCLTTWLWRRATSNIMRYNGRFVKSLFVARKFVGKVVPQIVQIIVAVIFHDDLLVVCGVDERYIKFAKTRIRLEGKLLVRRVDGELGVYVFTVAACVKAYPADSFKIYECKSVKDQRRIRRIEP